MKIGSWRFDKNELAGAFGDLGTFIPLVTALIIRNGIDPKGVFLSFGLIYIYTALVFRVPIAVQPMKAVTAIMITQALQPSFLVGAGILISIVFIILAFSDAVDLIYRVTPRSVVRGIQLGLSLNLILIAFMFMQSDGMKGWILSIIGVVAVLVLRNNKKFPSVLLPLGIGVGFSIFDGFPLEVFVNNMKFEPPQFMPANMDFMQAGLVLVVPQIPLTICNAILATALLCQDYFPKRKNISIKRLTLSHGIMNFIAALLGGIPVCHGAGGLAGHYRFGARTGGGLMIIGVFMLMLGLFYSNTVVQILSLFPLPILGVLLFFSSLELLTLTIRDKSLSRCNLFIALFVSALSISFQYGYASGLVGGIVLDNLIKKSLRKHSVLRDRKI